MRLRISGYIYHLRIRSLRGNNSHKPRVFYIGIFSNFASRMHRCALPEVVRALIFFIAPEAIVFLPPANLRILRRFSKHPNNIPIAPKRVKAAKTVRILLSKNNDSSVDTYLSNFGILCIHACLISVYV